MCKLIVPWLSFSRIYNWNMGGGLLSDLVDWAHRGCPSGGWGTLLLQLTLSGTSQVGGRWGDLLKRLVDGAHIGSTRFI